MKLREPIEKLYLQGKMSMSDHEILAATVNIPLNTALIILEKAAFDLANLAKWSCNDLMKFKGINQSKAAAIISAFELGRRRIRIKEETKRFQITSSFDVYEYMKPFLLDESVEFFYILILNRRNQIMKKEMISQGGTNATLADPKIIFKHGLDNLASGLVLVHNHPSGNLKASEADLNLTKKLCQVGKSLEIPILDHVIFTDCGYFSFKDESLI